MKDYNPAHMAEAIRLSEENVRNGGGPFGCVVVKGDQIVARGRNLVTVNNDPTAHAEVVAIRNACKKLDNFQLSDCTIYTSCEPCPMCLGAIYWARPKKIYFANTKVDAARFNFDDQFIYDEVQLHASDRSIPMIHVADESALKAFQEWDSKDDRIKY